MLYIHRLEDDVSRFWKSVRRWLPGLIFSLIALAVIIYFVDLRRLAEAIRSAKHWLLLVLLVVSPVWLLVRGIVWHTLLRGKASYRDVFWTLSEGYLLNNFLPFRLGEFGRAFLLGRKSNLGVMEILPTIVIERVLDVAFAAAILLAAVPYIAGATRAGVIALVIGGLVILGLMVLYIISRNHDWFLSLFNRVSSRWPRMQRQGGKLLTSLFSGLIILTDGWLFVRVLLWMTLSWAIAIGQFYLLLLAFSPNAQLIWALFGIGAVSFGVAIPSLPGAVGIYEGALAGALTLVCGDQSLALAIALTSHFISYISTSIPGAYAFSMEGETIIGIYRQLRQKQVGEGSNANQKT
jgi:uncharacterized protein (TIRG00374 family)